MSPSSSGSDLPEQTYAFSMTDATAVGGARRFANNLAQRCEMDETRRGRVGIVVNELANNLVKYARGGHLLLRVMSAEEGLGIDIVSVDRGPGLNPQEVLADGFTTGSTPGTGLGAVRRQADVFDIYSQALKGTAVFCRILAQATALDRPFQVGAVCLPLAGETVCGDAWALRFANPEIENSRTELMLTDGLGHGPEANRAALESVGVFREQEERALDQLLLRIHGRLKGTRGGALFLLQMQPGRVDFVGVGNVRAIVQGEASFKTLISQNGTAGIQIRAGRPMSHDWDGRGVVVLHSDGLTSRWDLADYPGLRLRHPGLIAGVLWRDFARGSDDATVVVLRSSQ